MSAAGFLLDTNVVSELRKQRPDDAVVLWFAGLRAPVFLSVIVIGEITRGVALLRRKDPQRAQVIGSWVAGLTDDHGDRILPVTVDIARAWGDLQGRSPVPAIDGLLAATALVHDLTLVTRNVKDVAVTGARIVNPFSS